MQKLKLFGGVFFAGVFGMALTLLAWRAVTDYQDFLKMRQWVGQMQAMQAEAVKAQQAKAPVEPAPANMK